ncbi:MAG: hypothetical protein ACPHID_04940 [Thermoplasmatota archaeon]
MAPETASTDVDMRPWWLTAIALAVALALNLATGNRLWLGYTLFGTTGFLIVLGLLRANRIHVPPGAVWMVGIAAALHYIGGSMAGLHQFAGGTENGLYYAFPWWDNVVHFLGCWAVGVAAVAVLARHITGPAFLLPLMATCVAVTVGALVELYEFAQFVFFATIDQGFYTNTLLDLYYNLLGGAAGAFIYARSRRGKPDDSTPSSK